MKVLLDVCTPVQIRNGLPGHEVHTAVKMGWGELENGELLRASESAAFDLLIICDKNLRHQQNLAASGVAVVVMVAASNRLADLVPLVPGVEAALSSIHPGDAVEVRI